MSEVEHLKYQLEALDALLSTDINTVERTYIENTIIPSIRAQYEAAAADARKCECQLPTYPKGYYE